MPTPHPTPLRALLLLSGVSCVWALATSCVLPDDSRAAWRKQLQASSPCYEVDLTDGLDDQSTEELHGLFDCLNRQDNLAPLEPTTTAFDAPVRGQVPVGVALVQALGALPDAGVEPWGLAGVAVDGLRSPDRPTEPLLDTILELSYGETAPAIRAWAPAELSRTTRLDDSPLVPLAPVLPEAAGRLLDDPDAPTAWLAEVLRSEGTRRWLDTLQAMGASTDPRVAPHVDAALAQLGSALLAADTPADALTPGPTGHSVRDLLTRLLDGPSPLLDVLADDLIVLLTDVRVRDDLEDALVRLHGQGHLEHVPAQVAWMASVDRDGVPLAPGRPSALHAFLRILHDANRPLTCSVDLFVTDVSIDLGNMAQVFLSVLADQSADTVVGASGVLSDVLGFPLSELLVDQLAASGACPVITPRFVRDLDAVGVLYEPEAYDLTVSFLELLRVLENGETDHLPLLADVGTDVVAEGAVGTIEEALRDLGPEPLLATMMHLVPPLARPASHSLGRTEDLAGFQDLLDLVLELVTPRTDRPGRTWHRLTPHLLPLVDDDRPWQAARRLGTLLAEPDSRTATAMDWAPQLLALDPDRVVVDTVATLLDDPAVARPLLFVVEQGGLVDQLLASTPRGTDPRVPRAFLGELVVDGTLDELLGLVDLTLDALDGLRDDTPESP